MTPWTHQLETELRSLVVAEYNSRPRWRYQAQCEGKHPFPTPKIAYATIRHSDMKAFKCKFCGAWHVAHTDRNRRLRDVDVKGKNHA